MNKLSPAQGRGHQLTCTCLKFADNFNQIACINLLKAGKTAGFAKPRIAVNAVLARLC
jgi:hypothetical protein